MTKSERQLLLDEIARRDEVIARQAAEILVLRQTIDALARRVFGVSSEKLDPAQLQLMLGLGEIAPVPAVPENPGAAPETAQPDHRKKKPGKQPRAPRIPGHLPLVREILDPPEVLLNPNDYRRIGEEVREQLHFKPAESMGSEYTD